MDIVSTVKDEHMRQDITHFVLVIGNARDGSGEGVCVCLHPLLCGSHARLHLNMSS